MAENTMRYGAVLPGGTATDQLDQAVLAERAGWDGVFVWEAAYGVDAWSLLAAIAARTSRVRLGTMLTPLPWRRPWKVASQVATLDQLSGGRAILAVGVGATDTDLPDTGEVGDLRARAERLDESLRRALRCDGIIPQYQLDGRPAGPDDARALRAWMADHGARPGQEIVADGETPADDHAAAASQVAAWADAGCTWWLETRWGEGGEPQMRERLAAGPPSQLRP
jgi:hypothetical protein